MARVRMDPQRLARAMRRRWANADDPPWGTLDGDPIEEAKARLLAPHLPGVRSVLDCGCGGGDFLALIDPARRFERVVGIDVAEQAIARARRTGRYADLICGHVEDAQIGSWPLFDLVLFGEMLYYIRDYRIALSRTVDRFLAHHGTAFISVAMGRSYFHRRDLDAIRRLFANRGFTASCDERIDYRTWLELPRRAFPLCFSQDSKRVLIFQRTTG
jgi:2-polyprenyl-3-methyl-5-hydroxy-6-metoxy-1,4-benzoquinol methylase